MHPFTLLRRRVAEAAKSCLKSAEECKDEEPLRHLALRHQVAAYWAVLEMIDEQAAEEVKEL